MTDYTATTSQWADTEHWARNSGNAHACILELRSRVKVLEDAAQKHIVETNSNIVALFSRVESLEAAERQASKVHQISKPLKLTAKQQAELKALMTNPTPLSPAAQAVMDAAEPCVAPNECPGLEAAIAAALRAAALYCTRERRILMTIADELEGAQ